MKTKTIETRYFVGMQQKAFQKVLATQALAMKRARFVDPNATISVFMGDEMTFHGTTEAWNVFKEGVES